MPIVYLKATVISDSCIVKSTTVRRYGY